MLNWANRFNIFCFLDNQAYSVHPHSYDCLLAVGARHSLSSENIKETDLFMERNPGWKFGHLSYQLKNSIHHFTSVKEDRIGFPAFYFFVPETVLQIRKNELVIFGSDEERIFKEILEQKISTKTSRPVQIQQRLTKTQYIKKTGQLQKHIARGDCYEINFCQEFFSEKTLIDPLNVFWNLIEISPNPFSALYRRNDSYLICASPERFLAKKQSRILSQPMKGTSKRNVFDAAKDEKLKAGLKASAKERSENVMVVDMVRNDLAKICMEASVKVDELFGLYTYPQVHQMVSTVSGELKPQVKFSEIIEATFPMGSMTGAPKHRVMQLIDKYEVSARGIFSGSVGYINPQNDFDFNVVIRSIMYNAATKYLSYQVGSGITFYSNPEKEWEECLLKAEAIKKVLTT